VNSEQLKLMLRPGAFVFLHHLLLKQFNQIFCSYFALLTGFLCLLQIMQGLFRKKNIVLLKKY